MARKLNVAQVVYDIGNIGGAENVAINIANFISKNNSSHIISLQSKYLKNNNITDVKYHSLSRDKGLLFLNLISLVIFVRKNNINILHAHNLKPLMLSIFSSFFIKGLKVIFHDHNSINKHQWGRFSRYICKKYVDSWICVSKEIKISANTFVDKKKLYFVNNPVDTDKYYFNKNKKNNRCQRFALIANYREEKNHGLLIESLSKISIENLVIDCFGSYLSSSYGKSIIERVSKKEITEKINLLSFSNQIHSLLDNYDVGLLVSKDEGLPITLLEYMSKGLPVAVPDVGQCKEIVENANCGIVFKKNDVGSLSNAIIEIFDKKDKWRLWGRNGRKYVKENHSIGNFGNKIYDIYNPLRK